MSNNLSVQIAEIAWCVLLLAGVVKCIMIARRPTTSAKCALALALVLTGFLISPIGGFIARQVPDPKIIRVATPVLMFACSAIGFLLGVMGLAAVTRPSNEFSQGVKQSIWAIGLSIVSICIGAIALGNVTAKRHRAFASSPALAISQRSTPQLPAVPTLPATAPAFPIGLHLVAENIRFEDAPAPWLPKLGNRIAPITCLELMRSNPEAYFIIICERHGVEVSMTSEQLVQGNIDNMKRESESLVEITREPYRVDGVDGIKAYLRAKRSSGRYSYVLWAGVHNGYSYRMITYGEERNEALVQTEADRLMQRFHVLDRTSIAHAGTAPPMPLQDRHYLSVNAPGSEPQRPAASANAPIANAAVGNANANAPQGAVRRSKHFEYAITTPIGWENWPDAGRAVPSSDVAALWGDDTCVMTVPMALGDFDVDADRVANAVARNIAGLSLGEAQNLRRDDAGLSQAVTFELDRVVDGVNYHYYFRTLKRSRIAVTAVAWTSNRGKQQALPGVLSSLTIDGTAQPMFSLLEPRHKIAHALTFNEIGLQYSEEKKAVQAIPFFERAHQLSPDDPQILDNFIAMQIEANQLPLARLNVNRNLKRFPKNVTLRLRGAMIAAELGEEKVACDLYAQAFAMPDAREDLAFRHWMTLLSNQSRFDEALAAIEKYRKVSNTQPIVIWHSVLAARAGKHDRAIELIKQQLEKDRFSSDLLFALASRYMDAEKHADAIPIIEDLRRREGANGAYETSACCMLGYAHMGLKQYAEAKTAFETGLKRSPNDKDCTEGLGYASAALGEGNNTAVKDPIDPIPLPMAIVKLPTPPTPAKETLDRYDGYYINRTNAISFVAKRELRSTQYRQVKVLTQRGVEMFSTLQQEFDPLAEAIFVNKVEVRDESGKVVATGKPSDCYIVDEPVKDSVVGHRKVLHVPIPGLRPGCTIELVVTTKDLAPPEQFRYTSEVLTYSLPVMRSTLYLCGDVDRVKRVEHNAPDALTVPGGLMWTLESPEPFRYEANQDDFSNFLPHVALGDPTATWESEGAKYLEQIRELVAPDESAIAHAKEITSTATTSAAKRDAILRQVQRDLTYKGIEFGRRARIPQRPTDIIRHRYGDCKDHALLAQQMLAAAGLKSHLVLVRTSDSLDLSMPSLDQFDHMIVCVQRDGGAGAGAGKLDYFDCTDKSSDLRCGVPPGLAGKDVLVLDPAKPRIERIPTYPAELSSVSATRAITIDAAGDVQASETLKCVGPWAAMLRSYMYSMPADKRTQAIQSMLSGAGVELSIRELKINHLDEVHEPLVIDMKYSMRRRFAKVRQQLIGSVPSTWERYCLLPDQRTDRETPYRQRSPYRFECTSTVTLPDGLKLAEPPSPTIAHKDDLSDGRITCLTKDRSVNWQLDLNVASAQIPAKAYADLVSGREKLIADLEPSLVLEPVKQRR